jgi:hypothetical protein
MVQFMDRCIKQSIDGAPKLNKFWRKPSQSIDAAGADVALGAE